MIDAKLSLVLPAHNEAENIEAVVCDALAFLPQMFQDYEVIVVDDGSKDGTGDLAIDLATRDNHVRVVHHPVNRGYGAALTSGFEAATGDYTMFMDSDRQFDIKDLARFEPYIGKYDIVAGYRIKRSDALHRTLMGRTFNTFVRFLFGVKVRDIDCGFKVFRTGLLKGMELTSPGALINAEIHAKSNLQGATITEVGVNHYPRVAGEQSGGSVRVVTRAFLETLKLWWRLQFYTPPGGRKGTAGPFSLKTLIGATIGLIAGIVAFIFSRRKGCCK